MSFRGGEGRAVLGGSDEVGLYSGIMSEEGSETLIYSVEDKRWLTVVSVGIGRVMVQGGRLFREETEHDREKRQTQEKQAASSVNREGR